METVRVDIAYRPLRICWVIKAGDLKAFRTAVRQSYAIWGGRFNPIVVVEREAEAEKIIEAFRADWVYPLSDSDDVRAFAAKFAGRGAPSFVHAIFSGSDEHSARASVLDVRNALVHLRDRADWRDLKDQGFRRYEWQEEDPLSDVFLVQLGAYPSKESIHIDYTQMFSELAGLEVSEIGLTASIPADLFEHPSIASLSRYGLEPHHSIHPSADYPGFFVGDASSLDDLVAFWNLRAADMHLCFLDLKHVDRFRPAISPWIKWVHETQALRPEHMQNALAVWCRREDVHDESQIREVRAALEEVELTVHQVGEWSWNGFNIVPPTMALGESSTLGVLIKDVGKPKLSFSLSGKPFSSDIWFHGQHVAASISFIGGLFADPEYTLRPPYVPELNSFYQHEMSFGFTNFRIESERLALLVGVGDSDAYIYALSASRLFEKLFDDVGYVAKASSGGLIARQLIQQVGGLFGAYVFRIPGVRRLIRTYGLTETFTRKAAYELIAAKDRENPTATPFSDFAGLHIEPRKPGEDNLQPDSVFGYLVEKGLFRIGAELACPHCLLKSWISLDSLKQQVTCEMCGKGFDATRQLIEGVHHFRRSGVLGFERNAQGAVPVVLTLQQLNVSLNRSLSSNCYATSLDLFPKQGFELPPCEIDLIWLVAAEYPEKTIVVLGECKDRGNRRGQKDSAGTIDARDIENLKRLADRFPKHRFDVYVLLAKLTAFTPEEIELAKTVNDSSSPRVILLTDKELESWHLFEHEGKELDIRSDGVARLAEITAAIYFKSTVEAHV
ncbi:hypothetical protein GmRootV118_20390 [Variovorax sp. V118]